MSVIHCLPYLFHLLISPYFVNFASRFDMLLLLRITERLNRAMENKTTEFLIRWSTKLPTSTVTPYIIIYGLPNLRWQITCDASSTNTSCIVWVEQLKLYISEWSMVNEY